MLEIAKYQIKFYVDEDEKKRLDTIAKRCAMPTANYVKSIALGVRIWQPKEVLIYVDSDELKEPITIEQEVIKEVIQPMPMQLSDEDRAILQELYGRFQDHNKHFKLNTHFNPLLLKTLDRILGNQP